MARKPGRLLRLTPLALALGLAFQGPVFAVLPTGPQVTAGSAQIGTSGNAMTVTNAPNTIINWNTFSIGQGNAVNFAQQSSSSAVLNRVVGGQLSEIHGRLTSNGQVFLVNPRGILVGAGAVIDTSAFVASTLPMLDIDFLKGKLSFSGDASSGSIVNHGMIRTGAGGRVILAAPHIENAPAYDAQGVAIPNTGLISAPGGRILLAAGQKLTVGSMDLEGVQFEVQAATDSVLNVGRLLADGGAVNVLAGTLRHSGDIRANSLVRDEAGQIVLRAKGDIELSAGSLTRADGRIGGGITIDSATGRTRVEGQVSAVGSTGVGGRIDVFGETVSLGGSALINASGASGGGSIRLGGDYQGANPDAHNAKLSFVGFGARLRADATREGDGGRIIVWADGETRFLGSLSARGGPAGGNGGFAEVSGKGELLFMGGADLGAPRGVVGGLLLDPLDLFIDDRGGINPSIINEDTDFPDNAVTVSPITLEAINGRITLVASRDMRFNDPIGVEGGVQGLTARAGRDMHVGADISATGSIGLSAGRDLQIGAGITTLGSAVSLDAGGTLSTFATTPINTAGGSVTLTGGAISGPSFNVNAGVGAVSMTSSAGNLSAGVVSGSGSVNLSSTGGTLSSSALISTGTVTLASSSSINVSGNVTSVGALAMSAPGSVSTRGLNSGGGTVTLRSTGSSVTTLGNAVNSVAGQGPAGGAVTITGATSVSSGSITAGNANVGMSGTSVSSGTITTTANVTLTANDGNVTSTVNEAAAITATSARSAGSTGSASVTLSSTSTTTALNATTVTATAGICSTSAVCPSATINLSGSRGVNVGTVTASAPATTNRAVPFNIIGESISVDGQNGPILAMNASSQITAADVTLRTNQGAGGGIGTIATPLRVDVEQAFDFRPNGEFGVQLVGSGPNQLSMQLGVAAAGLIYSGSLTKAGQINLAATANDAAVTVSDFTINGGFDDLVFNSSPSISLAVPNGSLVAQNVSMPAGDQAGRDSPFDFVSTPVIQNLPVTLSGSSGLTVTNYTRAVGSVAKTSEFTSSPGSVTLGAIDAHRDAVTVGAGADMTLLTRLVTRGNVTINAATSSADTGNVTIGGTGIDTTSGAGNVTITANSTNDGHGEVRSANDSNALEVASLGTVTVNARKIDTALHGNPFDVSGASVSFTTTGPSIGRTAAPVTANTQNLTINAGGNFNVDTGLSNLVNLTVTASPSGVGNLGLAQVTTNGNTYGFGSDGSNFRLENWTSVNSQFAGGTLAFTSTSGNIALSGIDFSGTNGSLTVRAGQRVTGNITQVAGSTLDLGTGFLTIQADNDVVLESVRAGNMTIIESNQRIAGVSDGSCEVLNGSFHCAPRSVATGSIVDPTGTGSFSIDARRGITTGNLQVGNVNFFNRVGAVNTGAMTIGSSLSPLANVSVTSGLGSNVGSVSTGPINTLAIGARTVSLVSNNGNVSVTGSGVIDATSVTLRAIGFSASEGQVSSGNINPSAATSNPSSITISADTSITTGTLDAASIRLSGRCCTTFPSIGTGAIGGNRAGNSVRIEGSTILINGPLDMDLAGTGQALEIGGTGNVTIAGNVRGGQGGTFGSPLRISAGGELQVNGGSGNFLFADGSILRLSAANGVVTNPFRFRSIDTGANGSVTIDAPAGIRQTIAAANGGGITAAIVNLSATGANSEIVTVEGTNPPAPLALRQVTDLTLVTDGSVNLDMPDNLLLSNLDISRSNNLAGFSLTGFGAGQSATVTRLVGTGVRLTANTPDSAPMRFRYQNGDGSESLIDVTSINSKTGQVIIDSTSGNVTVGNVSTEDPLSSFSGGPIEISAAGQLTNNGTIDGGFGSVVLNAASVSGGAGSSVVSSNFVRVNAASGDIGASGALFSISSPRVELRSGLNAGPPVAGHTYAALTGTTDLNLDADLGFTVTGNVALTDLAVKTRGDQAGVLSLTTTPATQTFGFARAAGSTVEVSTIASSTPLANLRIEVTNGNLGIIGTGASSIAADNLTLKATNGNLTLDATVSSLILDNLRQDFSAGVDIVVQASSSDNQELSLDAVDQQRLSAGQDFFLFGGAGDNAPITLSLNGGGSQDLLAGRNIAVNGGTGTGSSVTVAHVGSGSQQIDAGGALTVDAGTGANASITIRSDGANVQRLYADGLVRLAGGGTLGANPGAAVLVSKTGGGRQEVDAGGSIGLAGGAGDVGSVTIRQVGGADQAIGESFCCSNPTDNLTLQGGDGANASVSIETDGTQFIRPTGSLSLSGGGGTDAFARIVTTDTTGAGITTQGAPQRIGYSDAWECCNGVQISTIALAGGSGARAYAEIRSAGTQRVALDSALTVTGGTGAGAHAMIVAKAQDVRGGNATIAAGTGSLAHASIEADGTGADATSDSSALQDVSLGNLILTGQGAVGAPGNTAAASVVSGGTQSVNANATSITGGVGPNSGATIKAANSQSLSFGALTLQGGTGANARATIETASGGQFLSASTTQIIGGTGLAGAGQDAGAFIINTSGAQTLFVGNLTIRSGADFAPAGIVNLGTGSTQEVNAGLITIETTSGANGISVSPLGGENVAAIVNLPNSLQSIDASGVAIDNQFSDGTIGILSNTANQAITGGGAISVANATANGIARIDAATDQSFSTGSVTVSSSGAGGEARITGATQSFGNSGVMTVEVAGGGGSARIVAAGGTQTLSSSGGFRVRATGGSGSATLANAGGPQVVTGAFVDVSTSAGATGDAQITATGDQSIHTTDGRPNADGSLHVAALGSGTARIDSGGSQLLEIDYPDLMRAARDGRITIGDASATGVSFVRAAVDQNVFARSISLLGGQAVNATAKMTAANTQNISTLLGGIAATGGSGDGASALIDPIVQTILVNGALVVSGGAGVDAVGGLIGSGSQVVLVTQGLTNTMTVTGGSGTNAFGQITTSGSVQRIGTSGGFVLTGGTGINADAIVGANGGASETLLACGLGTCSFAAIPAASNPFVNGLTDVGVYFNPTVVPLDRIAASDVPSISGPLEAPFDPDNLVLWDVDWDPDDQRFGRYRFGRALPVCR